MPITKKTSDWRKANLTRITLDLSSNTDADILKLLEKEGNDLPKASRVKSLLRELIELRAYYNRD